MKINIKVVPNSKVEQIQKSLEENTLKIWVKGKPVEGEANRAVIKLLAKHFGVPQNHVKIASGLKNRSKIIEIQK